MDPRRVILEVHEALERESRTFIVGEWAVLARLKPVMPVKVALQRMFAAEDVLSLEQGQRGVADAMQTLERPTSKWKMMSSRYVGIWAFQFDFHISSVILPLSMGFPKTPFLASAQRDQVVDDGDLPI